MKTEDIFTSQEALPSRKTGINNIFKYFSILTACFPGIAEAGQL
jgi:hypothetical protein